MRTDLKHVCLVLRQNIINMKKKKTMKELPEWERPYEKCRRQGADSLSDAELLAVILRSGTRDFNCVELAGEVLSLSVSRPGLLGLHELTDAQLQQIPGIGPVKAMQLRCIGELCIRMADTKYEDGIRLTKPELIAGRYMEHMRHLDQEHILLLLLDSKCCLLQELTLSIGSVNQSILTPRETLIAALQYKAVHMILLHNHPSGDPSPSHADIQVTKRVKEAGELIGIPLIDHIIIGDQQYISLKEQSLL